MCICPGIVVQLGQDSDVVLRCKNSHCLHSVLSHHSWPFLKGCQRLQRCSRLLSGSTNLLCKTQFFFSFGWLSTPALFYSPLFTQALTRKFKRASDGCTKIEVKRTLSTSSSSCQACHVSHESSHSRHSYL